MLPEPAEGFRWVDAAGRSALVCDALGAVAPHFFTTNDWSLAIRGASPLKDPWPEVARAAGVPPERLLRLHQVHGASVIVHRAGAALPSGRPEADAILSDDPSVAIAVQAADCVPLLLADRRTGAIAAVHAGWRGLAAGTATAAVREMTRVFGTRTADLVVAAGPSIGACCYEVGEDVRNAFGAVELPAAEWFRGTPFCLGRNPPMPGIAPGRPGKWFFDGWRATRDLLARAGVDDVHQAELCTASHPEFPSYRRDGKGAGRLAAVIAPRR